MDEQEAGTERSQEAASDPSESASAAEGSETAPSGDDRDAQEGRSGDTLAWLEGPAFNAPIEEMPTLQWPDVEAEVDDANVGPGGPEPNQSASVIEAENGDTAQPPDELEDAMIWLETLAKDQGTPIDDMPTLVSSGEDESDLAARAAAAMSLGEVGDTTPPPQLDSDPMAWLEQLAIDQNSPLEELPSVADRLLASEIVSQIDPEPDGEPALDPLASQVVELDDALQYLENEAAAQGISLDEITFDQAELAGSMDEDLDALDQMASASIATAVVKGETDVPDGESENDEWDDLSAQIPEDPDEALVWLGELAEEESSSDAEKDASAFKKGAAAVAVAKLARSDDEEAGDAEPASGQVTGDQALDPDILEGMPDDPDEAMVWMEGLAAQNEEAAAGQVDSTASDEGERPRGETSADESVAESKDFALARAALASGAAGAAAEQYRKLLDSGQGGSELIGELETAVAGQPDEPELVQLLGDAYMQNGQLQKALKTYSREFDQS